MQSGGSGVEEDSPGAHVARLTLGRGARRAFDKDGKLKGKTLLDPSFKRTHIGSVRFAGLYL